MPKWSLWPVSDGPGARPESNPNGGDELNDADRLLRENESLRSRLSGLSRASLRVTEDLDLDTALQEIAGEARSLTGARYAVIATLPGSGEPELYTASGLSPEDAQRLWDIPGGLRFFEYLSAMPEPLRVADFAGHARSMGLLEFLPPMPMSSLLAAPVRHRGAGLGHICVAKSEPGEEFSSEDEETLVMFASQAALVIANARRLRDERRARADLETLIDTSPVGVVVFDARTGRPTSFNREALRIVDGLRSPGQSPEELLDSLTIRRADGQETALPEMPLARLMSAGEALRAEEMTLISPDGHGVSVLVNATPIRSEGGEVESYVVTLQDLTELEELSRLRAEFLAMASHELRAPLTSIKGSVVTLRDLGPSLGPAETLQFHRIIEEQADHMQHLIADLLDVARIEVGALSVFPRPTGVAALVDSARNTFLSAGGGHDIRVDLSPDLPMVTADRRRVGQVLDNLLSNAARHSPQSSGIRVAAVRSDAHVQICVADDGVGISAERLPGLFRKTSMLEGDDGLTESGMGLVICKGIVEAHGGRIWAESDGPGLGARFSFTLPAVEPSGYAVPVEAAQPSPRRGRSGRNRVRVLAVDDDPRTLRLVRGALSEAGYEPTVTGDTEEVGRLMEETRPHLVVLDLMLPGTDGIRMMESVPGLSEVPVIFLSAHGGDRTVARALEAGADDYIVKPFSTTELVARVRAVLRRWTATGSGEPTEPYAVGELTVNYAERRVSLAGRPVRLTDTEYRMLFELSVNAGRVLAHAELLQRVWGPAHSGRSGAVRSVIKNLRRKLGDDAGNPTYIFNQPRVGYRMPKGETAEQEGG